MVVFKPTNDGGDITFQFKENSKKVGEIKTTLQALENENEWTGFGNAHVAIDRALEDIFYRSDFFSEHFEATPESQTRARRNDPMAKYKQDAETMPRAEFFVDGMASVFKDVLTVYDNTYYKEDLTTNTKVEDNKEKEEANNTDTREKRIHLVSLYLGVDENNLKKMMDLHLTEQNLNEFGRYDALKGTIDKSKAKAYFEAVTGEKVLPHIVMIKTDKLLRDFILQDGFDIEIPTNREGADTNGQMATTNDGKMEENDAGRESGIQTEGRRIRQNMSEGTGSEKENSIYGGGETVHSVDGLRGGRELSDREGQRSVEKDGNGDLPRNTGGTKSGRTKLGEAFTAYAEQLKNNAKVPVGIYRAKALENAGQHAGDSSITEKEFTNAQKQMRAQDRLLRKWVDANGDAKAHNENNPERRELEKQLIKDYYNQGEYAKEKQAYLILGLPAAGKSSLADPLSAQRKALIVDSDEFKKRLPEFENGAGANYVHEESSDMADNLLDLALEDGTNVVYPVVGKTPSSLQEKIDKLKEAGYDIHLAYVDLPVKTALKRATNRYIQEGRLVGLAYIESIGDKPIVNFHDFKNKPEITDYALYDNDVAFGESPILKEGTDYLSEAKKTQGKEEVKKAEEENTPKKTEWKEQVRLFIKAYRMKPSTEGIKISPKTGRLSKTVSKRNGVTVLGVLTPLQGDALITIQVKKNGVKVGEMKYSLQDAMKDLMPQTKLSVDLVGAYNEMLNKDEPAKSVSEVPKEGQENIDKTTKGNNNESRKSMKGVKEDDTGRPERRGDIERGNGTDGKEDLPERGNHHSGAEGGMAEGYLEDGERETVLRPGENRDDRPVRQSGGDDVSRGVHETGERIQTSASDSDRGSDSKRAGVSHSRRDIGGGSDATGGDTGRKDGSGESLGRTHRDGNGDGSGQPGESSAPVRDEVPVEETKEEAQKNNERPTPETVRRGRFYSTKKEREAFTETLTKPKERVEANKEAMDTYLRLTKGGTVKNPTEIVVKPKDLKVMSKFSGWGGLGSALNVL